MARRRTSNTPLKTWLIRAGIGIAAGILIGFGIGAAGVRYLQPPGAVVADTSATTVDSTRIRRRGTDTPDETSPAEAERPSNGVVVPELVGMEEGDARAAIVHAGFTVGSVTFRSGPERLGTVVASFPVPGEAVPLPATINLILSDGKVRADSAGNPSQH